MILEPGTKFYKDYKDINRNDDIEYKMYLKICKRLEDYNHYEISNFAKDDFESKHNKIYWKDENYYGFRLSSSGYINQKRYTNEFFYPNYKRKIINEQKPINFSENIDLEKREFEFIITVTTNKNNEYPYFPISCSISFAISSFLATNSPICTVLI